MIPQILHQTWKDRPTPAAFSGYMASWKRFLPRWQFKFWTDSDLAALIDARYPQYARLFHAYPKPVMRADLGRYLLLREFGGIYADLDAEALTSFDSLISADVPICAYEPPSHSSLELARRRGFESVISNAIILSPAGHPFWDHLLGFLDRCRHANNPLDATGPFVFTRAVECAPEGMAPRVLPAYVFSPADKFGNPVDRDDSHVETLANHHWAGTWWKREISKSSIAQRKEAAPVIDFDSVEEKARRFLKSLDRTLIETPSPRNGRVLIAVPVRDAAGTLELLFQGILALRYPRHKLSLAFLEGNSSDDSLNRLKDFAQSHAKEFRKIIVLKQDAEATTPHPRWDPTVQRKRRSHLAKIRNTLLEGALSDEDWVLWIDADIIAFPNDVLGTLLSTGARIAHPNAVRIPGGPSMDLNAWMGEGQLSPETMAMWIRDGLYQPPQHFQRLYLSDLRYRDRVGLCGVGGTMLLVDANLHRAGLRFPSTPYRFLIETEGLGAAACDIGIVPAGLPNVEIIHAMR